MEYPQRPITSVQSACEWIAAEWAEKDRDGWWVAREAGHVPATPRQAALLDKAAAIIAKARGES